MCNCTSMVRTWDETHDGKYPASQHAPPCEDFQLIEFSRFIVDGAALVDSTENIKEVAKSFDDAFDGEYKIEQVMLTQDQFDNMPEFAGW